jgi:hypothetical protein
VVRCSSLSDPRAEFLVWGGEAKLKKKKSLGDKISFQKRDGNIVYDEDDKPCTDIDGTGFIFEDLALPS